MAYKVSLTRPAEADAYAAYDYIRENAPLSADKWLIGLFAAIKTLSEMPSRCPVIPEAAEFGHIARHLIHGKKAVAYRIIYDIAEEHGESPHVRVLRIWRASRDALTMADIEDALD